MGRRAPRGDRPAQGLDRGGDRDGAPALHAGGEFHRARERDPRGRAGQDLRRGLEAARSGLEHLAREYGLEVPLDAETGQLPVGMQQRVEILKALHHRAEILILDEPTAVLTPSEADQLFRMLSLLRDQGKTVILVTHSFGRSWRRPTA